jgi:hypothetical protein
MEHINDTRPLVLLDVDGVINDIGALHGVERPWKTHLVPSRGWLLCIPDYMPGLIAELVATAEVWWCTTWRHNANAEIAGFLGIDPLPVVDDGGMSRTVDWKPGAALPLVRRALVGGREVYWIEDFYRDPPVDLMPEGVVFIDTAAETDRPVLTEGMVPARLRGPVEAEADGSPVRG